MTVRVFMSAQVVEIARVSLFLIVATPLMLSQDLRMTALSLSLVPVIVLFAVLFFRKVRGLFQQVDQSEGRLTTVIQENLTGVRVVRAFARREFEIEKFLKQDRGETSAFKNTVSQLKGCVVAGKNGKKKIGATTAHVTNGGVA